MKDAIADYEEGVALMRDKRYEQALRVLEPLLEADSKIDFGRREHSRMLAGFANVQLGRWKEAIVHFKQAMVNDIECIPACTALGHAYLMCGDTAQAIETFRMAVQRAPKNAQARHGLGWSLLEEGKDLDDALYQAQEALRLDPDSAAIRDTIGWIFFKMEDYEAAAEQLHEAIQIDPDHPVILKHWKQVKERMAKRS